MSPASYQTAPPRVAYVGTLDGWNVECLFRLTFQPSTFQPSRAGNGTRTRDPNLGKVVLYQLSYSRMPAANVITQSGLIYRPGSHGGEGDRTPDLVNAIHALSQLSYAPVILPPPRPPAPPAPPAPPNCPGGNTASYRGVEAVSSDFTPVS